MDTLLNKKVFKKYLKEMDNCRDAGQKGSDCVEIVHLKYLREIPGFKNLVYPWKNYDWNYQGYIDNNYNSNKTGATQRGTFSALFKNPKALTTLLKGFTINSNPDTNSKSNNSDQPKCKDKGCNIIKSIKDGYNQQTPPYPDKFFNKNLSGENSSSYFIKTGSEPKTDLNKKKCLEKGYTWQENPLFKTTPAFLRPASFKEGTCFKNKYAFIKNKSGIQGLKTFKGEIPSFIGDLLSLSPINIYKIIKGDDAIDFENMESFQNYTSNGCNFNKTLGITNFYYGILLLIFIIWLMIIIMYFYS